MLKLSIIVPIYGVERYLRKCVDSLLAQDIISSEYEIILVDDESPDACPQICEEYAAAHKNIRVVHRKNGGLSAARNSGIEIAQGKYLMFVDSDDFIEPNVLKGLIAQAERDNLDVLRYRLQYVHIKNERVSELMNEREYEVFLPFANPFRGNDYSTTPTDGIAFLNTRMNTQCYAWVFMVCRELTPLFTTKIHFEDVDWTPRLLVKAQRVASTDTIVYNYVSRDGSITQEGEDIEKRERNVKDALYVINQLNELIKENPGCEWLFRMRSDLTLVILGVVATYLYNQRAKYLNDLQKLGVFPLKAPYSEISVRSKVWLSNLSPRLAINIMHILNSVRQK